MLIKTLVCLLSLIPVREQRVARGCWVFNKELGGQKNIWTTSYRSQMLPQVL